MNTHVTTKVVLTSLVLLTSLSVSHAASGTWTGGGGDMPWSDPNNWSTLMAPGTGDTATFNGAGNGVTMIDFGTGVTIGNITFDTANAAAYTFFSSASGTLSLNDGGTVMMTPTVANNQLFNAGILLGTATAASYTFTNASAASTLTLAGNVLGGIGGTAQGKTLTLAGNILVSGVIGNGGSSALALQQAGVGTTLTLTATNTFTGPISGITGTLVIGGAGLLGGGTGPYAGTIANNGTFVYNSSAIQTNTGLMSGTGGLVVTGPGTLAIGTSPSTYSGPTSVNGGILLINSSSGGNGFANTSPLTINPGGELDINASDALGYTLTSPITNAGIIKKLNSQSETMFRPIFLTNGSLVTTLTNVEQFESFGNYIATFPNTTNFMTGPGKYGLRTATCYISNAANSVLTIALAVDQNVNGTLSPLNKLGAGSLVLTGTNTFGGNIIISNGTVAIGGSGSLGGGSYSGNITNYGTFSYGSTASQILSGNISNAGTINLTSPANVVLAGIISGAGALTQNGSGTVALYGTNNYTGLTTVNAGKLLVTSLQPNTNPVVVNDGGTFGVLAAAQGSFSPSTLTVGSAAGATLQFAVNSTTQAPLTPAILNLTGNNKFSISGALVAGNSYPLLTYGALQGTGSFSLTPVLPNGVTGTVALSGNTYTLTVTAVNATLWKSAVNNIWDINTTANWTAPNGGTTYLDGSPVQFDDSDNTGGLYAVSNTAATILSPSAVLVSNSAGNYSFSSNIIIAGAGGLIKTGTGNLTNSGQDTYTGPTVINQGSLIAGVAAAGASPFGFNSAVSLANAAGASLILNNLSQQIGSLSGGGAAGGNVVLGSGTLTLGGDNSSQTYAGSISGTGGLTQIGSGSLTLSGTNSFTGAINQLGAGALVVTGTNTLTGSIGSLLGTLTIGGSGRLNATYPGTIANGGVVNYNSSASETNSALISGVGALNVNGPGMLTYSVAPNLMSGRVTVNGGVLQFLSSSGGNGCFESAVIVVNPGGELDLNASDALGYGVSLPLTNYGIIKKINSQAETLFRPIYLAGGSLVTTLAANQFETFGNFIATLPNTTNYISGPGNFGLRTAGCYISIASNSVLNISTVIYPYTAGTALNLYGTGTAYLSAVNTYTGGLSNTATVVLTNAGSLGSGTYPYNITNNGAFVDGSTAAQTLSGVMLGTGSLRVSAPTAALTLTGVDTYSGPTTVAGGTLFLSNACTIANTPSITVSNGATFDVSGLGSTFTLGGSQTLAVNGIVNGSVATVSGAKIYAGSPGGYGTNTFKNNLTVAPNAVLGLAVGPAYNGANGLFVVDGTLTANGNAIHITAPSTSSPLDTSGNDYILISAPGGISSNFNSAPVFDVAPLNAANYTIVTDPVLNQVRLHYSAIAGPLISGSATPASGVLRNQSVLISATVEQGTGTVTNVSLNLVPFGGSPTFPLVLSAVPNVYTNTIIIAPTTPPGSVTLVATATDTTPLSGSGNVTFSVVSSTETWDGLGSSGNWDTNANWLSTYAPGYVGDSLIFAGTTGLLPVMDNNYTVGGVTFSNTAGAFTIAYTGTALTLINGGGVTNNSVNLQSLEMPMVLGGGETFAANAGNLTLGQSVSEAVPGTGVLTLAGTNTNTLLGINAYTGGTIINSNSTLNLGGGGQLNSGAYAGAITDNGLFNYNSTANQTISSIISGTGALLVNGAGDLTLTGHSTFTGGTTVNNGTLTLSIGGGAGSLINNLIINTNGTVVTTVGDAIGYTLGTCVSNVIINGGTFNNTSGANESYATEWFFTGGNVTSTGGAINFNTGYGITSYASGTEVDFAAPIALRGTPIGITNALGTVPGGVDMLISGTVANSDGTGFTIAKYGPGALALSGNQDSLSNTLAINAGTLIIADPGQLNGGNFPYAITDNGSFIYSSTAGQTLSGIISGTGPLQVNGNGQSVQLTLAAANTYFGATTVVSNGYLTLSAAASINNSPSIYIGTGSTMDVSAISAFSLYGSQILSGSGTVTGSVGTTPATTIFPGTDGTYGTLTFNGALNMGIGAQVNYDLGTLSPADGGTNDQIVVNGTLTLSGNNTFHIKAPSTSASLDTSDYVLMNTGGISGSFASTPVWVVKPVNAVNYTIQTGPPSSPNSVILHYSPFTAPGGSGSANPSVNVLRNETILLTVTVTNSSSAIVSVTVNATPVGGSVVTLYPSSNPNVYTNKLTIPAATGPGPETLTATITDSNGLIGTAAINFTVVTSTEKWNGAGPDENWDDNTNWVSGAAPGYVGDSLVFAGHAGLAPLMDQNYTIGGLGFDSTAGVFDLGTAANTLTLTTGVTNNSPNVQTLNLPIILNGFVTFAPMTTNLVLVQPVSGTGTLNKTGAGTVYLLGANTYTGPTSLIAGTLDLDSANDQVLPGLISGNGSLTIDGPANVTLSSYNTYSGGTIVNNGNLNLTVGGGAGTIIDILTINAAGAVTATVQDAIGYTIGTCVSNLIINGGTFNNNSGANESYNTQWFFTGGTVTSTGGAINFDGGYGITTYASSTEVNFNAPIVIRTATPLGFTNALGTVPGGTDMIVTGIISQNGGAYGISKYGLGTLSLAGYSTYAGVTTLAGGNLQANAGENAGLSGPFGINTAVGAIYFAGGTLQYTGNNQYDYSSRFSTDPGQPVSIDTAGQNIYFATALTSSGGSLTVTDSVGSGVLNLTAVETYTGNTTINGGTLALGFGTSLSGSSSVTIAAGGTLDVTMLSAYTLGSSASLTAGGTAAKPAVINGGSGESISLGSSPIILNYDGADPALTISQGTLSLNGNTFTINGAPLPSGSYVIVTQVNGSIGSSGTYTVNGTAVGPSQASIAVNGGQVVLTIKTVTAPPTLFLKVSGGALNFSWAPSQLGSTLQSNSISLAKTNDWFNVAGSTTVTNLSVGINKATPAVFFRLLAP